MSRFGDDGQYWAESAKMLATLLLSLRGTPYIYQGQEIGMTNFDFTSMDQVQDVESHSIWRTAKRLHIPAGLRWRMIKARSRDNARTPMQWDESENGGFTTGTPWLGVNANAARINMAVQKDDPGSVRSYYKRMIALRAGSNVLKYGAFRLIAAKKHLFSFEREYGGSAYRILLSFSRQQQKAPCEGAVLISNYGRASYDGILQPYEAVIIEKGGGGMIEEKDGLSG